LADLLQTTISRIIALSSDASYISAFSDELVWLQAKMDKAMNANTKYFIVYFIVY